MKKGRRRETTAAETALWREAMKGAKPLRPDSTPPPALPPAPLPKALSSQNESQFENKIAPPLRPRPPTPQEPPPDWLTPLGPSTPGLDRRTAERMRRGEREPEARVDLHGMTLDRAHGALLGFIRSSHALGLRFVLVITGKGGDYPNRGKEKLTKSNRYEMEERRGAIRNAAPRWLAQAEFRIHVSGVYPAHPRHGGEGALYVYLRRRR